MSKRRFRAEILVETDEYSYDDEELEGMSESEIHERVEEDALKNAGYLITEITHER